MFTPEITGAALPPQSYDAVIPHHEERKMRVWSYRLLVFLMSVITKRDRTSTRIYFRFIAVETHLRANAA